MKTSISEVLAFSLTYYMLMPINKIEGYKKGYLDEKGNILKEPDENHKELINPYIRMVLKIKHMCRGREHELFDFLKLKSISDKSANNVIDSLRRTSTNKTALKLFKELLDKMDE